MLSLFRTGRAASWEALGDCLIGQVGSGARPLRSLPVLLTVLTNSHGSSYLIAARKFP